MSLYEHDEAWEKRRRDILVLATNPSSFCPPTLLHFCRLDYLNIGYVQFHLGGVTTTSTIIVVIIMCMCVHLYCSTSCGLLSFCVNNRFFVVKRPCASLLFLVHVWFWCMYDVSCSVLSVVTSWLHCLASSSTQLRLWLWAQAYRLLL